MHGTENRLVQAPLDGTGGQWHADTFMQQGLAGTKQVGVPRCLPADRQARQKKRLPDHQDRSRCAAGQVRRPAPEPCLQLALKAKLPLRRQVALDPAAEPRPAAEAGSGGCGWRPPARAATGGAGSLQRSAKQRRRRERQWRALLTPPLGLLLLPPPLSRPCLRPCHCRWPTLLARPPPPSAAHAGALQRWAVPAGAPRLAPPPPR